MNGNNLKTIRRILISVMVLIFALAGAAFASTSTRTMQRTRTTSSASSNGYTYVYKDITGKVGDQTYVYHKLSVPTSGILVVSGYTQTAASLRMVLCNSGKKVIDCNSYNYVNCYKNASSKTYVYYGVNAGTYYIRVDAQLVGKGKRYLVSAQLTPARNQGGTTASNAKVMSRGTMYYDIFPAGKSASFTSNFKFYANGSTPVKLRLDHVTGQGYFEVQIKGPSWPSGIVRSLVNKSKNSYSLYRSNNFGTKIGPKPGWYYVSIRKRSGYRNANGYFRAKWTY